MWANHRYSVSVVVVQIVDDSDNCNNTSTADDKLWHSFCCRLWYWRSGRRSLSAHAVSGPSFKTTASYHRGHCRDRHLRQDGGNLLIKQILVSSELSHLDNFLFTATLYHDTHTTQHSRWLIIRKFIMSK